MVGLLGGRGASAVMGLFMLALGSSRASAQSATPNLAGLNVPAAVRSLVVNTKAQPLGTVRATPAVATAQPLRTAPSVTVQLPPSIEREASWLHRAGWPLYALVDKYSAGAPLNEQANCIATAVYFEARGENLEGQLAVAKVIMNRAASGKYPGSWCEVVKQPWQFSFVNPRTGEMPQADTASYSWRKALGVTRLAVANAVPTLSNDVLWYHADYVAPSWGRRLSMVQKIGAHIFYRA